MTRRSRRSKSKKGERKRSRFTKFRSTNVEIPLESNRNTTDYVYNIILNGKTEVYDLNEGELVGRSLSEADKKVIETAILQFVDEYKIGPEI